MNRLPKDSLIVSSYHRTHSIYAVAKELNMIPQTVHKRLRKAGIACNGTGRPWTNADEQTLKRDYVVYRNAGKLSQLAERMNRTKPCICRQAKALGLTDENASKFYAGFWKYMTEEAARVLMDDFKSVKLTLGRYCKKKGLGEVGFWQTMTRFFPDEWEHVIESKAPKDTMYRTGRRFEYAVRDKLKGIGYFVMRSPASRSPIDLVGIMQGVVLFIQCKVGGSLPPSEWNVFFDLAESVGAIPVLASRDGYRGIEYMRLLTRKRTDGTKKKQPFEPFDPEQPWKAKLI